jgi:hypothetical protein
MGNGKKFTGQKGVNNCAEKDNRGNEVERFLPDAVFQDCADTFQVSVMIAFQTGRKLRGDSMGHVRGRGIRPSSQTKPKKADYYN